MFITTVLNHHAGRLSHRLESQMTSDIQAILQLLQRQTTAAGPPAYSTVTSSPEYQTPTIMLQPGSALQTDLSLAPAPPRPQVRLTALPHQVREEGSLTPGQTYSFLDGYWFSFQKSPIGYMLSPLFLTCCLYLTPTLTNHTSPLFVCRFDFVYSFFSVTSKMLQLNFEFVNIKIKL